MGVALALSSCTIANPAFDPDGGKADGGTEGNGDTTQSGDGEPGDGDAGDGDPSPGDGEPGDGDPGDGDPGDGDPGDGDPGDGDGDSGMEAPIEPDVGVPACFVETHPGLWPYFGAPGKFDLQQCPAEIGMYVRVVASDDGNWIASPCPGGCYSLCELQKQLQIGVGELGVGLATLFPPLPFDQQLPWVGCYFVEAVGLVKEENIGCYYSSLSIHRDQSPSAPMLFNANRESWGLTPIAIQKYGDWQPLMVDQDVPTCACEQLEQGECCPGHTVVAKHFTLGDPVFPGETGFINLLNTPFTFYGAQAQGGTSCEIDPETSWALWAD